MILESVSYKNSCLRIGRISTAALLLTLCVACSGTDSTEYKTDEPTAAAANPGDNDLLPGFDPVTGLPYCD